jgi:hypothetical protein
MKGVGTAHEPDERAPTLRRVDPATTIALAVALVVVVVVSWTWRRAVRSGREWQERALTAETTGREQRLQAQEERRVRDLSLSTMDDGVLLIGRDASVAFANDAIDRHLQSTPTSLVAVLPVALRGAINESRERSEPTSVLIETGVPARWLHGTITPAGDHATPVVGRDLNQELCLIKKNEPTKTH